MPDFSVPDWIKPPSAAEQERIDEASAEASRKAYSMIRRGIGVNRMRSEAQEAAKNGVDPVTAYQNALLNNWHLISGDHPEAINSVLESQQAEKARQRALDQAQAHLSLTAQHYTDLADEAKAKLEETTQYHAARLASETLKSKPFEATAQDVINKDTGEHVPMVHTSPNRWEMTNVKPNPQTAIRDKARTEEQQRRAVMDMEKMLQKDEAYGGLLKNLTDARAESETAGDSYFRSQEKNDAAKDAARSKVKLAENAVKDYRNQTAKNFNIDLGGKKGAKAQKKTEEAPIDLTPIPQSEWKVDSVYRGKDGKLKAFKGMDKDGKPIWEEQ